MEDDPREVLALLNSLGFIGITAQQLKAFLKDLKLYRKIKERERQQRKEEMTQKILMKQQYMIQEIIRHQQNEIHRNIISSDSVESHVEDPWLKLRVRYQDDEESDDDTECLKEHQSNSRRKEKSVKQNLQGSKEYRTLKSDKVNSVPDSTEQYQRKRVSTKKETYGSIIDQSKTTKENLNRRIKHSQDEKEPDSTRQNSAKSQAATSTKSSAPSGSKSFIRPWRLQPEIQTRPKSLRNQDPVSLYHKYQKEWKQISFPGEAKHTAVRWAIREKMLGYDPHPLPPTRKYKYMTTMKKQ